jgi:hypothetical protein
VYEKNAEAPMTPVARFLYVPPVAGAPNAGAAEDPPNEKPVLGVDAGAPPNPPKPDILVSKYVDQPLDNTFGKG